MAWRFTRLRADREELHDRHLLALVGPRPDVDEEAAQVVAQEPRVAAADADAGEQRRRAEEQHDEEVPPAMASRGRPTVRRRRRASMRRRRHARPTVRRRRREPQDAPRCRRESIRRKDTGCGRLRELQLLERAHVGPDEVDRQQVRQAEGPVVEEAREGPPARAGRERAMVTRRILAKARQGGSDVKR
jgi:hypothetical protein